MSIGLYCEFSYLSFLRQHRSDFAKIDSIFQTDSILIEYSPTDRKKNLQIKYSTEKYIIFMYKLVRKCGQNRDFIKFHSAPKNQIFNMT